MSSRNAVIDMTSLPNDDVIEQPHIHFSAGLF